MLLISVLKISKSIILPKKVNQFSMSRTIKLLRVRMMKEKKLRKKAVLRMRVVQKKATKYQLNGPIFPPKSNVQALIYLQNLLSEINLSALEKDL